MATLREMHAELEARKARYEHARKSGWSDAISSEKTSVDEFQFVYDQALAAAMAVVLERAGDVELGPLPVGHGLVYSQKDVA